jgi:hypothetical protein
LQGRVGEVEALIDRLLELSIYDMKEWIGHISEKGSVKYRIARE